MPDINYLIPYSTFHLQAQHSLLQYIIGSHTIVARVCCAFYAGINWHCKIIFREVGETAQCWLCKCKESAFGSLKPTLRYKPSSAEAGEFLALLVSSSCQMGVHHIRWDPFNQNMIESNRGKHPVSVSCPHIHIHHSPHTLTHVCRHKLKNHWGKKYITDCQCIGLDLQIPIT